MELPVESLRVTDPVDFPLIRVVDDLRLWFRWRVANGSRYIAVKKRDVEQVILPDLTRKV
jgi:hypothetical protein